MVRLGLTGGIGSGKTTVAGFFGALGATVIDADAISRRVTAAGGLAIEPISRAFGADFITPGGALDRTRMRQASFSDAPLRARLEAIIHPLVSQESARLESEAAASGAACIVFDVPLLVESRRWRQKVDRVIVVDCPNDIQIERVMARSALARDEIERIIASQATRSQRLHAADVVIFNAGVSREQIALDVEQIASHFGL
jgi:dephospho-CoA kinase